MAQIIRITSEALQATIRRLLPSQVGFGEDLQASNVIQPIIDLTPTAEGSALATDLARAWDYSTNSVAVTNTRTDVITTTGFFRLQGVSTISPASSGVYATTISQSNGLANKDIWSHYQDANANSSAVTVPFDMIIFNPAGFSVNLFTNTADSYITGHSRQVADVYGNITNPDGFTFE